MELKELKEGSAMIVGIVDYGEKNLADGFQPLEDGIAAFQSGLPSKIAEGLDGIQEAPSEWLNASPDTKADYFSWLETNLNIPSTDVDDWAILILRQLDGLYEMAKKKSLLQASA